MTVTVKKTAPSPEAVQILYQRMRYEYEFYHYVKEQFHLLKRKFGLKPRVSHPPLRPSSSFQPHWKRRSRSMTRNRMMRSGSKIFIRGDASTVLPPVA